MRFRQHQGAAQVPSAHAVVRRARGQRSPWPSTSCWPWSTNCWCRRGFGFPNLFFETNTAVVVLFVVGEAIIETQRLRAWARARVAHWLGGVEITDPDDALERRLSIVVDEMAIASAQPSYVFIVSAEPPSVNCGGLSARATSP